MGLDRNAVDTDAIAAPFVHQYWCEVSGKEFLSHGFQGQYFSSLGRELLALEIALHFTRQIAFDNVSAAPADIATKALIAELEYEAYLDSIGLRSLLCIAKDVAPPTNLAEGQFHALVGLLHHYRGHEVVRGYLKSLLTGELELQEIRDAQVDPKTLLQNVAQIDKVAPAYEHTQTGPAHKAFFTAQVRLGRQRLGSGKGTTKSEAEAAAAAATLAELEKRPGFGSKIERALQFMRPKKMKLLPYSLDRERARGCNALARHLGVNFDSHLHLLDHALTHASFVLSHPETRSYERLALPGARITNILVIDDAITEFRWQIPGAAKDAVQARMRVLNAPVLPKVFDNLGLGKFLRADAARTASRERVKADAVQALLAAAYEAEGMKGCQRIWGQWIRPIIAKASVTPRAQDAVTALQEITQELYRKQPEYRPERDPKSPAHKAHFLVRCFLNGDVLGCGEGPSIKEAKQAAARQAIAKLKGPKSVG